MAPAGRKCFDVLVAPFAASWAVGNEVRAYGVGGGRIPVFEIADFAGFVTPFRVTGREGVNKACTIGSGQALTSRRRDREANLLCKPGACPSIDRCGFVLAALMRLSLVEGKIEERYTRDC